MFLPQNTSDLSDSRTNLEKKLMLSSILNLVKLKIIISELSQSKSKEKSIMDLTLQLTQSNHGALTLEKDKSTTCLVKMVTLLREEHTLFMPTCLSKESMIDRFYPLFDLINMLEKMLKRNEYQKYILILHTIGWV